MNNQFVQAVERLRARLKPYQYLWHGTSSDAKSLIKTGGFRGSFDGALGPGVYTTNDPKIARAYGRQGLMFGRDPGMQGARNLTAGAYFPTAESETTIPKGARSSVIQSPKPGKGSQIRAFHYPEDADKIFGVGKYKNQPNREALQSALKVFDALKMLQNPLSQLGQELGKQIWASRGKPNAARMSLMGGNAPTYRQ